jgi:flagellar basal-body rod modification protein FlgD
MQLAPLFGAQSGSGASGAKASMVGDFDRFLSLLTTQLQHQDPMSPLDANEFTAQLVAFSGVEQAIRTNSNLESLLRLQEVGQAQSAIQIVGKRIDALGDAILSDERPVDLFYTLEAGAQKAEVSIVDSVGRTVRSLPATTADGLHRVTWDGLDDNGGTVAAGVPYFLQVTATDAQDRRVATKIGFSAVVEEIRNVDGVTTLTVAGRQLPLDQVLAVRDAS